ncbi:SYP [Hepatospora eriocheir]|uniref:Proline--tRNA ligase n=2 Tax=Hepatospora eriocheir TaxID=1081669 RepID=A0A1X0QE15_9MICR|nr:SYP [Hepatospora eriocheir]
MDQKFGIKTRKEDNFTEWFLNVVKYSELIDYHDIRGCYIMRPASMYIWNLIKESFDNKIKELGVDECYFPMLVSKSHLEKEKEHLESFDPELAWITKCGNSELQNPVAIRPTSETIIYPFFAKWLKTHRDLPLKINQWCNVLRWEVKSTLPFIRGREFLWQEGHTAHYTKKSAEEEVREILETYRKIYEDLLAVPVIAGVKSKEETFGGAEYTLSVEAFIPGTGKGVQGATAHHLGQNFSKMFDIKVSDDVASETFSYVYQNCWGISTRSIGVLTMLHSDNKGFVSPPRVAHTQLMIIPCGITKSKTEDEKKNLYEYIEKVKFSLNEFRVKTDLRDNVTPGNKFNNCELKGIPLRIDVGFKDLKNNEVCLVRRDTCKKIQINFNNIKDVVTNEINNMHNDLFNKAKSDLESRLVYLEDFDKILDVLNKKNIIKAPWCNETECEISIKERTTIREGDLIITQGAKTLCIPFDQSPNLIENSSSDKVCKCIGCDRKAKCYVIFGRSY